MQALIETLFDAVYLVSVITIGILMIRGSKGNKQFCLFGLMAVVLGAGDSFHLIPRALALCTTGLENYTVPLGLLGREPEAQISAPFPFSLCSAKQQGHTDVRPKIEPVHAPVIHALEGAYFPVDRPIGERKPNNPFQHPAAQAVIEVSIHLQPVMRKKVLCHRYDNRHDHFLAAVYRCIRLRRNAI